MSAPMTPPKRFECRVVWRGYQMCGMHHNSREVAERHANEIRLGGTDLADPVVEIDTVAIDEFSE